MSRNLTVLALVVSAAASSVHAAESHQSGTLSNITSVPEGLLVMLDAGIPDNCAGTPYGWMLIPEANKTMVATALVMWTSGNRQVALYTAPRPPSGGFCVINQLDPA